MIKRSTQLITGSRKTLVIDIGQEVMLEGFSRKTCLFTLKTWLQVNVGQKEMQ